MLGEKIKLKKGDFKERFDSLIPIREQLYESEEYKARGFIDAIEKDENGIVPPYVVLILANQTDNFASVNGCRRSKQYKTYDYTQLNLFGAPIL